MTQEDPHIDIEFLEKQVQLLRLQLQMYFENSKLIDIELNAHLNAREHMETHHSAWVRIVNNLANGNIANHVEYQKRLYLYYSDVIARRVAMEEIREWMEGLPND